MPQNTQNTIFICDEELRNVLVKNDNCGNNEITRLSVLKYNKLINNKYCAHLLRKNVVIIEEKELCDIVIVSDNYGNHQIKVEEMQQSEDIFKNLLVKLQAEKKCNKNINDYLREKREKLERKLLMGNIHYNLENYVEADNIYQQVVEEIEKDCYPDEFLLTKENLVSIKLALAMSKIAINNRASLSTAEEILQKLISKHGDEFPQLYYYLTKVLINFKCFLRAKSVLDIGFKKLKCAENIVELKWPASDEKIDLLSEKSKIEKELIILSNQCNVSHFPDGTCYFSLCDVENHSIYFNIPTFTGCVKVKCSNNCIFNYHRNCWKKKIKNEGIKNVQALINLDCGTSDCGGIITEIVVYDEHLNVISTITDKPKQLDKKHREAKQPKNAKDQKKASKKMLQSSLNFNAKEYIPTFNPKNDPNKMNSSPISIESSLNAEPYDPFRRPASVSFSQNQFSNKINEDKSTQTFEHVVSQFQVKEMKNECQRLKEELFKSEENCNDLINQVEKLMLGPKTCEIATDTKNLWYYCEECSSTQSKLINKSQEYSKLLLIVEELKKKNNMLAQEVNDLKTARLLERECFNDNHQKLLQINKNLDTQLNELRSKENTREESEDCNKTKVLSLRKVLLEQINFIADLYMKYFSTFENKCKKMIWELEDLKSLTNINTLPSNMEVEENMKMWQEALQNTNDNRRVIMGFYENLSRKFCDAQFYDYVPAPSPNVLSEPPNLVLRHFKALFIVNKRLEQDLNKYMATVYKMISTPYPGTFPNSLTPIMQNENNEASKQNFSPLTLTEISTDKMDNREVVKEKPEEGASGETKTQTVKSNQPNPGRETSRETVQGQDGLVMKLQQNFPLISQKILSQAVRKLRERRGNLSGMDGKDIMIELKKILKDSTQSKYINLSKQNAF